jgi:hypothetical protein
VGFGRRDAVRPGDADAHEQELALQPASGSGVRVALATDESGRRRVAARLDRLGIAYRPERRSIYVPDLDGNVLEVMATSS